MTKATMALAELAEKGPDADLLREMIQYVAQRMMEMDVEGRCGAAFGERSPERANSRNGYRERTWDTRAGSVELKIPKLRQGSYFPGFLEPRRTAEKALAAVIQEAYVQGVSTRSVDELVKAMGMSGISKSQVSPLCAVYPGLRAETQDVNVPACQLYARCALVLQGFDMALYGGNAETAGEVALFWYWRVPRS